MRYFTRERYLSLQNTEDDAMDSADAQWDKAVDSYDRYLQTIPPEMPESVRQLVDGFYLHDAHVLSMGRRGDALVISLQLDTPPNDLLTITYSLSGALQVTKEPFAWIKDPLPMDWLHDEVELVEEGSSKQFVHAIMFSNGWEIRIPFREVQTETASPIVPYPPNSNEGTVRTSA
jgi:hypothetical protein